MISVVRWLAFCLFACLFLVHCSAVNLTAPKDYYVNDYAGVLSQQTKDYIITENIRLEEASGAQVVVVTVNDTEGLSLDEYTYRLFNDWGIGSKQKENRVLLGLDIQGQEYHCVEGIGFGNKVAAFTIIQDCVGKLEPDFAVANYDEGVRRTFDSLAAKVENAYGAGGNSSSLSENNFLIYGLVILLIIIAAVKAIIKRIGFGPLGGMGGNFGMGMLMGSSSTGNYRRSRPRYRNRYDGPRGGYGGGHSGGSFTGGGGASRGGGAGRGH